LGSFTPDPGVCASCIMKSLLWLFFSFNGRIGRMSFVLGSILPLIAIGSCIFAFVSLERGAGLHARTMGETLAALYAIGGVGGCALALAIVVGIGWMSAAVQGKRLQDFGWNSMWVLAPVVLNLVGTYGAGFAAVLPAGLAALIALAASKSWLAYLAFFGMLLIREGDEGPNAYERGDAEVDAWEAAAAEDMASDMIVRAALSGQIPSLSDVPPQAREADDCADAPGKAPQARVTFGRRRAA